MISNFGNSAFSAILPPKTRNDFIFPKIFDFFLHVIYQNYTKQNIPVYYFLLTTDFTWLLPTSNT